MTIFEALLLGIIQGLTEFLPVSSSGHLELGKALVGIETSDDLAFTVLLHGATVMSIIIVFYKDLWTLISGVFRFRWNQETKYVGMILISMVPVGIVGVFFEDQIDALFQGKVFFVGMMLLITAGILFLTRYAKQTGKPVGLFHAVVIGVAQAIAVLPGISRSGATIACALLIGIEKEQATRFSFLMVVLPILGATVLKVRDLADLPAGQVSELQPFIVGFLAAFISGLIACRWMIHLVKKGKIAYFSIYCFVIGSIAIISQFI